MLNDAQMLMLACTTLVTVSLFSVAALARRRLASALRRCGVEVAWAGVSVRAMAGEVRLKSADVRLNGPDGLNMGAVWAVEAPALSPAVSACLALALRLYLSLLGHNLRLSIERLRVSAWAASVEVAGLEVEFGASLELRAGTVVVVVDGGQVEGRRGGLIPPPLPLSLSVASITCELTSSHTEGCAVQGEGLVVTWGEGEGWGCTCAALAASLPLSPPTTLLLGLTRGTVAPSEAGLLEADSVAAALWQGGGGESPLAALRTATASSACPLRVGCEGLRVSQEEGGWCVGARSGEGATSLQRGAALLQVRPGEGARALGAALSALLAPPPRPATPPPPPSIVTPALSALFPPPLLTDWVVEDTFQAPPRVHQGWHLLPAPHPQRRILDGPATPPPPSSSLRVTLGTASMTIKDEGGRGRAPGTLRAVVFSLSAHATHGVQGPGAGHEAACVARTTLTLSVSSLEANESLAEPGSWSGEPGSPPLRPPVEVRLLALPSGVTLRVSRSVWAAASGCVTTWCEGAEGGVMSDGWQCEVGGSHFPVHLRGRAVEWGRAMMAEYGGEEGPLGGDLDRPGPTPSPVVSARLTLSSPSPHASLLWEPEGSATHHVHALPPSFLPHAGVSLRLDRTRTGIPLPLPPSPLLLTAGVDGYGPLLSLLRTAARTAEAHFTDVRTLAGAGPWALLPPPSPGLLSAVRAGEGAVRGLVSALGYGGIPRPSSYGSGSPQHNGGAGSTADPPPLALPSPARTPLHALPPPCLVSAREGSDEGWAVVGRPLGGELSSGRGRGARGRAALLHGGGAP